MPDIRPSAALYDLFQEIGESDGLEPTLAMLDRRLRRLLPFDAMSVSLPRGGRLAPVYASGGASLPAAVPGQVAQTRRPALNRDPGPADGPGRDARFRSALAIPLDDGAELVGVLALYGVEAEVFQPADLGVLLWIRAELARAVKHALRRPRRESLDALTGLPDGRAALERLDAEVARSRAKNNTLGLLVCVLADADIRSRYGERPWSRLVKSIAAGLQRTCRDSDLVARANDEFVVALPGFTASELEAKQLSAAALADGIGLAHFGERIAPLRAGGALLGAIGGARELLAAARANLAA